MIAGVPYDAEVEYLESTGTQWIDTGVYGKPTLKTTLCMQQLEINTDIPGKGIFGCYDSTTANCYYFYQRGRGYGIVWQCGFGNFTNTSTNVDTSKHTVVFDDYTIYLDGTVLSTFTPGTLSTTPQTLLLFNVHSAAGGIYTALPQRFFSCKIEENGVIVHDYIPVRVGSVGYVYDRVTRNLLGNAGTGALRVGLDVATPVMGIHRYARPRAVLPEGARRLAYLESDGAQWIDTGFKANTTTTRFECGIVPLSTAQNQGLCGSRNVVNVANGQSCNMFVMGTGVFRLDWSQGGYVATAPFEAAKPYEMSITRGNAVINGESISLRYVNPESADQDGSFLVGNFSNGTSPFSTGFVGRWMWARLYSHGTLVRDFVPIAIGSTGYMYDAENEKIYPNAGSGAFALGEIGGEA